MSNAERLITIAGQLANEIVGFFEIAGPGKGDTRTQAFMKNLGLRAENEFGRNFAEREICGQTALRPDFYFSEEGSIVEIALSLRNPNSEFERHILKAIIAKEAGHHVNKLLLLCKPGGEARHRQPSSMAFIDWLHRQHKIEMIIRDLQVFERLPETEPV
jgi:hypothetical protein